MEITKKVNLSLVGLDGNSFALMGAFQKQARREDWSQEEIKFVLDEAEKGDYSHLLCTLMEYCEETDEEETDEEEEDEK